MSIKINIPSLMQRFTSKRDVVEVTGTTVGECLNHLVQQFPDMRPELFDDGGKVLVNVDIFVNGQSTYPEELVRSVKDGDELDILPVIGGG